MSYPLIVVEGIDGSGKSTLVQTLGEKLKSFYPKVFTTHFPGVALPVKEYLPGMEDPLAISLLFLSDLTEGAKKLAEWRKEGVVLVDRYIGSSMAYDRVRGISPRTMGIIYQEVIRRNPPTATIFIDIPVSLAMERIRARGEGKMERYERADILTQVREIYLEMARNMPHSIVIDGTKPKGQIIEESLKFLEKELKIHLSNGSRRKNML